MKVVQNRLLCFIADSGCTDQEANGEVCKLEMAAPPGRVIALDAINVLKETISE